MTKVKFTKPLPYGRDKTLAHLTLREPMAGDLRGLHLTEIAQMETGELLTLVTRIATEAITIEQLEKLGAADTVALHQAVQDFFNAPPATSRTTPEAPTD